MMVLVICMIPLAALLGFVTCAMLQVASDADRREEKLLAEQVKKVEELHDEEEHA